MKRAKRRTDPTATLAAIDSTVDGVCATDGCHVKLAPTSRSGWWCTPECQAIWQAQHGDRPAWAPRVRPADRDYIVTHSGPAAFRYLPNRLPYTYYHGYGTDYTASIRTDDFLWRLRYRRWCDRCGSYDTPDYVGFIPGAAGEPSRVVDACPRCGTPHRHNAQVAIITKRFNPPALQFVLSDHERQIAATVLEASLNLAPPAVLEWFGRHLWTELVRILSGQPAPPGRLGAGEVLTVAADNNHVLVARLETGPPLPSLAARATVDPILRSVAS